MLIRTAITGIGDPFILKEGDTFHAFATSAPDGILRFTSKDLRSWTKEGYCYRGSAWAENCFWAPEVYSYRGKYYLLYTGRWKANHSLRLGLAVANSPPGPFEDLAPAPFFDLNYACIDGTLFFDDDGKVYLYYVRDCSENILCGVHTSEIYCVRLSDDLRAFCGEPVKVASPCLPYETASPDWRWNEGPALLKHNGTYYMTYSVNCYDSPDYCIGCAVAASPFGPFEKYAAPILKRREGDFSGPGHNSFFRGEGEKLLTAFHIHSDPQKPSGDRRMCFAEAGFREDGTFYIDAEE